MAKRKQKANGTVREVKKTTAVKTTGKGYATKKKLALSAKTENQRELFKSIKTNTITVACGPPGSGKAQPVLSSVYTPLGPVPIGSLREGDYVSTPDGSYAEVLSIHPQGKKDVYRIYFDFNKEIYVDCCEDHLWVVNDKYWSKKEKFKTNKRLVDTKFLIEKLNNKSKYIGSRFSIDCPDFCYFESKEVDIDPYLLGCLIGDGSLTHQLQFSSEDLEIINSIGEIISKYGCSYGRFDGKCTYSIVSQKGDKKNSITNSLKQYGLKGSKSECKFIPIDYQINDRDVRLSLVQGLMDTDGTVDKKSGMPSYSTSSSELAKDFKFIIESLGGICSIRERETFYYDKDGNKIDCLPNYICSISYDEGKELFRLHRKKEIVKNREKYLSKRYIRKIEKVEESECVCIYIDSKEHLYLAENFIPTHNTLISVYSALDSFFKMQHGKIIFTRPCIEADGENLGFLPGDLNEKISPYMMPIFDFLGDYMDKLTIERMILDDKIMTLPLAFMRGYTFKNAFVLLDECISGSSKTSAIIDGVEYKKINIKSIKKAFEQNKDIQILSYNLKDNMFEYCKMNHFFNNGIKNITEIKLNNREKPLKVTSNHPFAVLTDGQIQWKKTDELQVGDLLLRDSRGKNNSISISNKNYDILIGLLLGDGNLSKNNSKQESYRLRKTHGLKQYEYMTFCKDFFESVEKYDLKSGYTNKPLCGFVSKSLTLSEGFINSLYENNSKKIRDKKYLEKYFSDRSLALWYMDDGSICHTKNYYYIKIHTEGFCLEENLILKDILDKRYSVDTKINKYIRKDKAYYFLRFNKDDSEKLFKVVSPYIIPSMDYKLPIKFQSSFLEKLYKIDSNFNNLSISNILSIVEKNEEEVYNMEIEGNNNYFIDRILVHNCQNTTPKQMKMFLTRIGENSKVVMTGDPNQSDIRGTNGLVDIVTRLEDVPNVGIVKLGMEDVIRHEIVKMVEKKYTGV